MKRFRNKHGYILIGCNVFFSVENPSMWGGDINGVLQYDKDLKEFYIQTKNSGKITIDKGYDAYNNTIIPKTLIIK